MDELSGSIIDFTEAAYDLGSGDEVWLPKLLEAGRPAMDRGLGVAGVLYGRPPGGGRVQLLRVDTLGCHDDFAERHAEAIAATPEEVLHEQAKPGQAGTMSENTKGRPEELARYTSFVPYCKDLLGITAVDPNGVGAAIIVPLDRVTTLSGRAKERWQMLGAHVCAAHRLRQGLIVHDNLPTDLPLGAEAVLDPNGFKVVEASHQAEVRSARERLRNAALRVDRARGRLRHKDPAQALELWTALVQGRWSLVDWFDSDGRRFVLALPNPPELADPRGLTERETQVVTYVVYGFTNKMISYQLGISSSRVSALLRAAMRKLNVHTRASLIKLFRDMQQVALPA
ncbi:MAG: LuxR C-terminal-related transcriptional regulator [Myxococcota bacterium]